MLGNQQQWWVGSWQPLGLAKKHRGSSRAVPPLPQLCRNHAVPRGSVWAPLAAERGHCSSPPGLNAPWFPTAPRGLLCSQLVSHAQISHGGDLFSSAESPAWVKTMRVWQQLFSVLAGARAGLCLTPGCVAQAGEAHRATHPFSCLSAHTKTLSQCRHCRMGPTHLTSSSSGWRHFH